jgi:hypothetical protein
MPFDLSRLQQMTIDKFHRCLPTKCSHPKIDMKNSSAGIIHVIVTIHSTLSFVRHARYLAAIFTEQKRSIVINKTVYWDTRQTV